MRPVKKTDSLILSKQQWTKVLTALSLLILILYIIATICSLCGSSYFILDYQNSQMDKIEKFFRSHHMYSVLTWAFSTLEFTLVSSFILKHRVYFQYVILFYLPIAILAPLINIPSFIYIIYPFVFYFTIPLIEHLVSKTLSWDTYLKDCLRIGLATLITLELQTFILIIKAGYFDGVNHVMNLSATFIYAVEYDIALLVWLYTAHLLLNREKGDSLSWTTHQAVGGSSQTSKTNSQESSQMKKKPLTKAQKNRIRLLYAKMYLIQIGTLLLVLVLPFLLGKVVEFLVMYVAFAVTRYILGFKYSLHFKKESLCVSVSLIVFGVIALAVPFFYVVTITAIILGAALAVLLHLSYKYKSLWLFNKAAKPDKFAVLYTFFDGNTDNAYITMICKYKGLDHFQTLLIVEYMACEKMSYMAKKRNYSQRMLIYKLDEAIDKLTK